MPLQDDAATVDAFTKILWQEKVTYSIENFTDAFTHSAMIPQRYPKARRYERTTQNQKSETFGRVVAFSRDVTDRSFADSDKRDTSLKSDTATVTDSVSASRRIFYSTSLSDVPALTPALLKTDFASLLEQADIIFNANKSDSLSLSEVESKLISKGIDESVSISDVLTFT